MTSDFKEEVSADELKEETDALTELFRKALGKDKLEVKVEKLKNENISSMMTLSEESRRMQDMMKMYGMCRHGSLHVRHHRDPGSECQQQAGSVHL